MRPETVLGRETVPAWLLQGDPYHSSDVENIILYNYNYNYNYIILYYIHNNIYYKRSGLGKGTKGLILSPKGTDTISKADRDILFDGSFIIIKSSKHVCAKRP